MPTILLKEFLFGSNFKSGFGKSGGQRQLIVIFLLISWISFFLQAQAAEETKSTFPHSSPPELEAKWGIKLIGIQLSAAGYMLDFRYQVIDPNKAKYLTDHRHKAYLIDQATGAKFIVPSPPKIGSLRQNTSEPKAQQIYFMLFANPSRFIKSGNQVTVIIEDFKAENLIVNLTMSHLPQITSGPIPNQMRVGK
jgi:hypothetical protein